MPEIHYCGVFGVFMLHNCNAYFPVMSNLPLKSKENRVQKLPPTTSNSVAAVPRRTVCLGSTTDTSAKTTTQKTLARRTVCSKAPDLLHPPKYGGQLSESRKPDITKNLPSKTAQKLRQPAPEKPKLDSHKLLEPIVY